MKRYESSIPRTACGLAAIAMTAAVLGIAVVLPATSGSGDERLLAMAARLEAVSAARTSAAATPASMVRDCDDQPSVNANGPSQSAT